MHLTKSVDSSYANILHDLKKELLNIQELVGKIDSVLLVALAFADKKGMKPEYGSIDSPYSMEEYLNKAREILIERPELIELGRLIDKANHHR